jgi:hypothetical protein
MTRIADRELVKKTPPAAIASLLLSSATLTFAYL